MSRYEPVQPEMDAAFDDSDDEETENSESQPLVQRTRTPPQPRQTPGGYDFENLDYDHPPPGSPPQPTSSALPNHWGNNNGHVPDFNTNLPSGPRRNWFQRAAATVLSDNMTRRLGLDYQPISGTVGGGNGNDGVFANVTAKPTAPVRIQEGDETFIVPEDSRPEAPPSYAAAQADAVPQYWETTIHAPFASDSVGDMIVDALPTGSLFSFLWNMLVSISFQFIGFLLTYLLHTSHASRLGSRAGLGVTLIQYGFSLRQRMGESYDEEANPWPEWKDDSDFLNRPGANNGTMPEITEAQANAYVASATTEWLSFFLMTIGWFILLTSVLGFWRVKRWESSILASHQGGSTTTAPMATTEGSTGTILGASRIDMLRAGFGFRRATDEAERDAVRAEEGTLTPTTAETGPDTSQRAVVLRAALEREAQLTNDLRRAGLL